MDRIEKPICCFLVDFIEMGDIMARRFTLIFMLFCLRSHQVEGSDNCPANSFNLIRMCRPVTIFNKSRFTIEFNDFELVAETSCRCSFIAPSDGKFDLAATSFIGVTGCGTKVTVSLNNVTIGGGMVACERAAPLSAIAVTGEEVTVTVSKTLPNSKISPYCYVATFPDNVTFTCHPAIPIPTSRTSTTISTTTTTTKPITTPQTSTMTTTTPTPSTNIVISSSPSSLTSTSTSSTSNIRTDPNTAEDQDSFPTAIVLPAAVGGALVIIVIIIVAVVCSRRSKSHTPTTGQGYQNEVFNDKDSSSDGIKDNVLYNSMDANYPDMNGGSDGHYSSVIRHSTKVDEDSHKIKELPQSANQEPQGPVYAVVDKGQKRPSGPPVANKPSVAAQSENGNAPVYAVPDKSQNKAKQGKNAVYDVPKNNSPVALPVRTSNQDGLLYSEIENVGQIPELPSRKSDPKPNDTVVYSEVRTEL